MGNMSPYYFKTIFSICVESIPSFIKIGGVVSEKNDHNRQKFVDLYIGYLLKIFIEIDQKHIFSASPTLLGPASPTPKFQKLG